MTRASHRFSQKFNRKNEIIIMDPNQLQDFLPLVTGFLGGATSAGVFAGPIQTLQDWWYINYGHNISSQAALLKATHEANVEKLKNDILQEVATIPPENVQDPSIKILGPALDASRYYIEEEELRKMFAKIIASSLDNRKSESIHSSFVEIIKQLDVLDAKILSFLKKEQIGVRAAVATMHMYRKSENGKRTVFPLIFLTNEFYDFQKNSISLVNLERLGLISIKTDTWLSHESNYDFIRNHPITVGILKEFPDIILDKSCFTITDYGKNFIDVCVVE